MIDVQIFDALGNPRTMEWLVAKYGRVTVHTDLYYHGPRWALWALCEDADYPGQKPNARPAWWPKRSRPPQAAAALVATVLGEDGQAVADIPVARYWPDAPPLPPDQAHWQPRGVIGYTNVNGDVGFGMGPGDFYHPPQQEGASWMWVAQPDVPTDAVSGLGMLIKDDGPTNHWHMNAVFRWDPGTPEPPPPPPPDPELLTLVRDIRDAVLRILDIISTFPAGMARTSGNK